MMNLKRILIPLFISFYAFVSCEKKDCNCGIINNDGIDNNDCYWLEITSDCSENKKTFCFDENVWMDAYVGDHFCVTGQPGW